jgi:hypothetical protein
MQHRLFNGGIRDQVGLLRGPTRSDLGIVKRSASPRERDRPSLIHGPTSSSVGSISRSRPLPGRTRPSAVEGVGDSRRSVPHVRTTTPTLLPPLQPARRASVERPCPPCQRTTTVPLRSPAAASGEKQSSTDRNPVEMIDNRIRRLGRSTVRTPSRSRPGPPTARPRDRKAGGCASGVPVARGGRSASRGGPRADSADRRHRCRSLPQPDSNTLPARGWLTTVRARRRVAADGSGQRSTCGSRRSRGRWANSAGRDAIAGGLW